jgi:hypothetical protein
MIYSALYPLVGITTIYAVVLFKNRGEIQRRDEETVSKHTRVSITTSNPMGHAGTSGDSREASTTGDGGGEDSDGSDDKTSELSASVNQISFLWQSYTPEYWCVHVATDCTYTFLCYVI